jgi:carbohydrate diacid regulator
MNISKHIALRIVSDISEIINQHVNMMDNEGIIIASTNRDRIGTYHAGAYKVISEQIEELVISNDKEYEGARKGINLPVVLNGDIVGVIGVTGEYKEVKKYSQIIKRMTEILLLENYSTELLKLDEIIKQHFFDDWLLSNRSFYDQEFVERGRRLGIDVNIPRRILVVEIVDHAKYTDNVKGQRIIDGVNKIVRMIIEEIGSSVFIKISSRMVCLIAEEGDTKMFSTAEKIKINVKKIHNLDVLIGIDSFDRMVNHSFIKAKKALRAAKKFLNGICSYNEITLETFIDEISQESKQEFVRHIFNGYSNEEIKNWMAMLRVYFNTNGSLGRTASEFLIHKNTLQYHLKKLSERTGRDPRKITDAALYYLAYQFYYDENGLNWSL